jgi:hypothetical protein
MPAAWMDPRDVARGGDADARLELPARPFLPANEHASMKQPEPSRIVVDAHALRE